jgi:hypothetical protein
MKYAVDYRASSEITGPLTEPGVDDVEVRFRPVASRAEQRRLRALVTLSVVSGVVFLAWLIRPDHVPFAQSGTAMAIARAGFVGVVLVEFVRLAQAGSLWLYSLAARDPVPMAPVPGKRVAVLTTIVPSKEPLALVARTLAAMKRLRYDGQVDVWLLDEGNDPEVRRTCARMGVRHFSRKGRPEYNQATGVYRKGTKAGNHNAWRAEHEDQYDYVAQMDPDHVPFPNFLMRTLGYFRDPNVAFVVAPQVYGNQDDGFVARAAASQAYLFHGVIQRGANRLQAPLLIGTNHVYRPSAWRAVGGYQDSIIEDHLTSLQVHTHRNPATGEPWKGVYTPDIVAVGDGPTSWTDYFNQQKRWAYGVWQIVLEHSGLLGALSFKQRLSYSMLEFFYPSLAFLWLAGSGLTMMYLAFGVTTISLVWDTWLLLWGVSFGSQLALFLWLRRFNLAPHERRQSPLNGLVLSLFTGPVYVAAAVAGLFHRPLAYVVTAKGNLQSRDTLRTFRFHLLWSALAATALLTSAVFGHAYLSLRLWATVLLVAASLPPIMHLISHIGRRRYLGTQELRVLYQDDTPSSREVA